MADIPRPNYDKNTKKLVEAFKKGILKIARELESINVSDFSRTQSIAILNEVASILLELDETSKEWVIANIEKAILDGAASAMVALGTVKTIEEAEKVATFNKFNKDLAKTMIADTQEDLLKITDNVDKRVKSAVRRVFAETVRDNYAAGINGRKTINQQTVRRLKKTLGDAINTGLIDAGGNRWKTEDYVDMITRTKMMYAHIDSHTNEAISRNAFYGIISSHGAKDACRYHEGRIVKLTDEAPGDYPTVESLRSSGQIFHHRCKHHISTLRDVNLLPESVMEKAKKQAEIGNKALATGKRNPEVNTDE